MPSFQDLSNSKYGLLTVIRRVKNVKSRTSWLCDCECGNQAVVSSSKLKNGHTKSCGCLQRLLASTSNKKHGHSCYPNKGKATKEYNTWSLIKRRCGKSATTSETKNYYEKGIFVCDEWANSFENFLLDMGYSPSSKHSIDRIDNNLGYFKENCRWTDSKTQARNKSNNIKITINGESKTIAEWSEIYCLPYKKIYARIKRGWNPELAVKA